MPEAVPTGAIVIWTIALLVVALVVTPLALVLLTRALRAARSIEAYLADMTAAGGRIAGNTAAVPALDETLATAAAMQPVAGAIKEKTGAVAALLSKRAEG